MLHSPGEQLSERVSSVYAVRNDGCSSHSLVRTVLSEVHPMETSMPPMRFFAEGLHNRAPLGMLSFVHVKSLVANLGTDCKGFTT